MIQRVRGSKRAGFRRAIRVCPNLETLMVTVLKALLWRRLGHRGPRLSRAMRRRHSLPAVKLRRLCRWRGRMPTSRCVFELADSTKLVALDTSRVVGVAFDFLLAAGHTGNGKPLSRFARFRDAPMCINMLAVDYRLAMGSIVVKVTHSFAGNFSSSHEAWQKMCARPNLWPEAVLGSRVFRSSCCVGS